MSIYVLGAVGVWAPRRETAAVLLLVLPAVYTTVVHVVLVGSVRDPIPAMPFLEVLEAVGVCWLAADLAGLGQCRARARPANVTPETHGLCDGLQQRRAEPSEPQRKPVRDGPRTDKPG